MSEPTWDTLIRRVDRLERQNQRIKRAGAGVLIGFAALLLMGQGSPTGQVIEAQRFVIRDPMTGKGRAGFSILQDGSVGLSISAVDGRSLSLSADAGGNMGFMLYDRNRKARAELFSGPDGTAMFVLRDGGGKIIWKAP